MEERTRLRRALVSQLRRRAAGVLDRERPQAAKPLPAIGEHKGQERLQRRGRPLRGRRPAPEWPGGRKVERRPGAR